MNEHEIAYKYVHGHHDALTDNQEKIDMAQDIMDFAKAYHEQQVKICCVAGVSESAVSKDFARLYAKISKGEIVPCFVDNDWRDGKPPLRDIAKVVRHKENSIMIGCRGTQYGGVDDFALDGRTELRAFTDECERLNLEYFT